MKIDILALLRLKSSVLAFKDILLASDDPNSSLLKRRLHYYVKSGQLYHIRKGLYAKDAHYDRLELATKIFTPAYISFETILKEAGVIYQHYSTIFVASYQSKEIVCDGQVYYFRKIKDSILTNSAGIDRRDYYFAASKERAFLDMLYINKNYHFDNLTPLDFNKIGQLLPIYSNRRLEKQVARYAKQINEK